MCINQRTIVNRRYVKAAGSSSRAEVLFRDAPDLYFLVDCGRCLPCLKKRSNYWRQRLIDEFTYYIKKDSSRKYKVYFVTLTIAPEYYKRDLNYVGTLIKKFRERYRKRFGCSLRFWMISEYGEKRGRLHLHAIFFNPLFEATQLKDLWQYGRVDMSVVGCSLRNPEQDPVKGIAYVTKYLTKNVDKWFIKYEDRSRIWCSPGIGKAYCLDPRNRESHLHHHVPLFFRVDDSGKFPQALPRYYIDKLFSPLDILKRARTSVQRLHQPLQFPITVCNHRFDSFAPYLQFVQSVGGRVTLLSTQFNKMSPDHIKLYLTQFTYE